MKRNKRKQAPKKKSLGKFASAIEKYCSDKLRESGIEFSYEEKQFTLMDSFRFTNKYFKMTNKKKLMSDRTDSMQHPIRYTPDFMGKDHKWIIETKGYLPSHHDFPMRWKIFLNHIMENNLGYDVYLAKNKQQVDQAVTEILKSIQDDSEETK
jgi:very-short-patch-repair endonuclease